MTGIDLITALSVLAAAILIGAAAVGSGLGVGQVAGKYVEGASRQPELAQMLQIRAMIMAGFLDAVPMIAVGVGLLLLFSNPLLP